MLIYEQSEWFDQGITYFKNRFQNSPEDARAAVSLMKLYRLENSPNAAIAIGKKAEVQHPNLPMLHVEMALAYLVTKNISQAEYYSRKVVESLTLEEKDKIKVINTFKVLALNNPEAQDAFVSILDSALSSEKNSSSKAELGEFYKSRDKDKALDNYKSALRNKPNDFKLIKNILELEIELGKYEDVLETSEDALESFPSQAFLFFAKGWALNKLERHQEAVEILQEGLDYIFDDNTLKKRSFEVLRAALLALGQTEEAKEYEQKLKLLN
jgi:tetratricopeptide (TPR) repeat protein